MPYPQDVIEGQLALEYRGFRLIWFSNGSWHSSPIGTLITGAGLDILPQDAVNSQIALGSDGSFLFYNDGWYSIPTVVADGTNAPQDVVNGQVVIGLDDNLYGCVDGQWYGF